jgi:hypothetical protein
LTENIKLAEKNEMNFGRTSLKNIQKGKIGGEFTDFKLMDLCSLE